MIGTVLGDRYRVTARVARGGMADVFSAVDERMDRLVAVKVLRPQGDPTAFLDELQAQARVSHDAVVRLYDAGTHDGLAYLVMEYVRGSSLKDVIGAGPLTAERAASVGTLVAEALAAAHARGIVHRDVKPANVLIDEEGQVRLADFGIARLSEAGQAERTGVTYGTAAYLAPEHVAGRPVGPPADVYALGLVLLEAVTGRREFAGPPLEAAVARLSRDPAVPDDLPPGWAQLLRAMTAREPRHRPTAAEVAGRLQGLAAAPHREAAPAAGGSQLWKRSRPTRRLLAWSGMSDQTTMRREKGRSLWKAFVAIGCVVVLAVALLTVATRIDEPPPAPAPPTAEAGP